MRTDATSMLESNMLDEFGPLMGGRDLMKALGYRSTSAFRRAERLGVLGVRVFSIPDRQGKFALTRDVSKWLESIANSNGRNEK